MKTEELDRHSSLTRLLYAAFGDGKDGGHAKLAAQMGESEQTITNWAKRGVSKNGAIKAEELYGCAVNWILSATGPRQVSSEKFEDRSTDAIHVAEPRPESFAMDSADLVIHQYPNGGGMGAGVVLEEKQPGIIKSWNVSREWIRLNVPMYSSPKNLCIVTGFGPSMKPLYNPGDPLLMDRGVTTVDQEGVYFFRLGEMGYIKQLQRIPTESGMVLRAKSINPSYDTFDITRKMQTDFNCFGRILTVWRSEQV